MQKVLVVEDDPHLAGLVRTLLDSEGFVPTWCSTVNDAWNALVRESQDAAIVDLRLELGESGWDLIERIRGNEGLKDLPVVVFSGLPVLEVSNRALQLNCAYLSKPFSAPALLDRLQVALRRAGKTPELRPMPVALLLGDVRVECKVFVNIDLVRFSDAWEAVVRDARSFLPVTDAHITTVDGGREVASTPLLAVRKDQVRAAFPLE